MARRTRKRDLPTGWDRCGGEEIPTGEGFRPEWIDFDRGIRVGNLEPHQRITRILKYHLEGTYDTPFVVDRWGRGVYWQWICWVSRANRQAKPLSSGVNFGCAKFFISAGREERVFKCGLQVERGQLEGPASHPGNMLQPDWDWNRLTRHCARGTPLEREFDRLVNREGFVIEVGDWSANCVFSAGNFSSAREVRIATDAYPKREWVGLQLYYPMPAEEIRSCTGYELTQAIFGVFREVTPAMNECMQVPLRSVDSFPSGRRIRET